MLDVNNQRFYLPPMLEQTNICVNCGWKIVPNCLGLKYIHQFLEEWLRSKNIFPKFRPPARIVTEHAQIPTNTHSHHPWQSSAEMNVLFRVGSKLISIQTSTKNQDGKTSGIRLFSQHSLAGTIFREMFTIYTICLKDTLTKSTIPFTAQNTSTCWYLIHPLERVCLWNGIIFPQKWLETKTPTSHHKKKKTNPKTACWLANTGFTYLIQTSSQEEVAGINPA